MEGFVIFPAAEPPKKSSVGSPKKPYFPSQLSDISSPEDFSSEESEEEEEEESDREFPEEALGETSE